MNELTRQQINTITFGLRHGTKFSMGYTIGLPPSNTVYTIPDNLAVAHKELFEKYLSEKENSEGVPCKVIVLDSCGSSVEDKIITKELADKISNLYSVDKPEPKNRL